MMLHFGQFHQYYLKTVVNHQSEIKVQQQIAENNPWLGVACLYTEMNDEIHSSLAVIFFN